MSTNPMMELISSFFSSMNAIFTGCRADQALSKGAAVANISPIAEFMPNWHWSVAGCV